MSSPDEIRAQIEETRSRLDVDVDALADKVDPHQIAERQKDKVRSRVTDVKESIMGGVRSVQDKASDVLPDSPNGAASSAASNAKATATGHPIIVGAIAFGAGWLLSSLLPSTQSEQQLAGRAKEAAAPLTEQVKETAKNAGQEIAGNLKEPAQQAAQHVQGTAKDAASTVQDEGRSAAQDVKGQAQDAKDTVQGQAQDAKDTVQGQAQDAKGQLQGQAQEARQNLRS